MYINETCEHYCGDEDCAKCDIYGILTGGCAGCKEFEGSERNCENCKHYKADKYRADWFLQTYGCSLWDCEYEPKDNGEEERMSIWAN